MIKGRDIVCISSIDWDFNWQGPQELTARLARAGNRVLYIENTGIRSPGLKDAGRVARRLGHWFRSVITHGLLKVNPTLYVHSPLVLPPFGASWGRRLNAKLFQMQVRRAVRHLGMKDVLILCYLPTDTAIDLIETLRTPRSVVVYYRVDNLALLTPHSEQLRQNEETLINLSDLVFANSEALAELPSRMHDKVTVFPPSVNLSAFSLDANLQPASASNDTFGHQASSSKESASPKNGSHGVKQLARPIIGYIGGNAEHINWDLIARMARLRPDWSWAFIGPLRVPGGAMQGLSNVRFFGQKPHGDLVKYIREFDVCIIPYNLSDYTATVVPTKLNEYLAVGKPVVSTNLPAVCSFNEEHNVVLTSDEQPERFLGAIEEALRLPKDSAAVKRRRAVAARGSWQTRIEAMSDLLESAMEAKEKQPQVASRD